MKYKQKKNACQNLVCAMLSKGALWDHNKGHNGGRAIEDGAPQSSLDESGTVIGSYSVLVGINE